jgi:hypothetical protein
MGRFELSAISAISAISAALSESFRASQRRPRPITRAGKRLEQGAPGGAMLERDRPRSPGAVTFDPPPVPG